MLMYYENTFNRFSHTNLFKIFSHSGKSSRHWAVLFIERFLCSECVVCQGISKKKKRKHNEIYYTCTCSICYSSYMYSLTITEIIMIISDFLIGKYEHLQTLNQEIDMVWKLDSFSNSLSILLYYYQTLDSDITCVWDSPYS